MCCWTHFVFFFKQKTAYEMRISDWSSDVCSSDLCPVRVQAHAHLDDQVLAVPRAGRYVPAALDLAAEGVLLAHRQFAGEACRRACRCRRGLPPWRRLVPVQVFTRLRQIREIVLLRPRLRLFLRARKAVRSGK